jgi:hypothetical protein
VSVLDAAAAVDSIAGIRAVMQRLSANAWE